MRTDNSGWRTSVLKQALINSVFGEGSKEIRIYKGAVPTDQEVFDLVAAPTANLLATFPVVAFEAGQSATGDKVVQAKTLWTIKDQMPLTAAGSPSVSASGIATWCLVWNADTSSGIVGGVGGPGDREKMVNLASVNVALTGTVVLTSFNLTHWGTE